jgi:hypothetical protein
MIANPREVLAKFREEFQITLPHPTPMEALGGYKGELI